ncbi:MAG: RNA-directed RNA polymerase [Cencurut virus]|nr:MAG: RNA-directed RNA polymerase [Cencurut virus]
MEAADILDGLNWEHLVESHYRTDAVLDTQAFFHVNREKGDGNCFFRSLSRLQTGSPDNHLQFRLAIPEASDLYFEEEPEVRGLGLNKKEYLNKIVLEGEWAGSLEASLLSKYYKITIIIWCTDESGKIEYGLKFGDLKPTESANLLMSGRSHFDSLVVRRNPGKGGRNRLSLLSRLESIEELVVDGELMPPTYTLETIHNVKETIKVSDDRTSRIVTEGRNIPMRVGRIIEQLFGCRLEFEINKGSLIILQEGTSLSGAQSLSKLGHVLLANDRSIKREYAECQLVISDVILNFLDTGHLLRLGFPGSGLHRCIPLLLDSFVHDVLIVVVSLMLSSFLYKSKPKYKRNFIVSCCKNKQISAGMLIKSLNQLKHGILYNQPKLAIKQCCEFLFGKLVTKITRLTGRMNGTSILFLRSVDFSVLSLEQYLKLLEDLSSIDSQTKNFVSNEVASLHALNKSLADLETDALDSLPLIAGEKRRKGEINRSGLEGAKSSMIKAFFEEKNMLKFVNKSGKASGDFTIGNVLSYAYNLYLSRTSLGFTLEDTQQLTIEIKKLHELQESQSAEPVAIICEKLEHRFLSAFRQLPKDCSDECEILFEDARNAVNYAASWKHALRLKGTMYEGFFSKQYNWHYIPEDLKPSLVMCIQTLFPSKFTRFLERTQLHPEYRDLTPDFVMTQRLMMEGKERFSVVSSQLKVNQSCPDSVDAFPIIDKRNFPLPEVSVQEVDSVKRIVDRITDLAKQSNSRLNRFAFEENSVHFDAEKEYEQHQLLFVEVGYQTDVDGKIYTDTKKWKDVLRILALMDIKASLIVCVDNSATQINDWWINEDSVRLLKGSISYLFNRLGKNSPADVTDIVVGSINTQKIRSFLKSGSNTKTPLTLADVNETWECMSSFISNRPTGLKLESETMTPLRLSLVEGTVISEDGASDLIDMLKSNSDLITDEFERTKNRCTVNRDLSTAEEMLIGWLMEDLPGSRCSECVKGTLDDISKMSSNISKLSHLAGVLQLSNHLSCCHVDEVVVHNDSNIDMRTPSTDKVNHQMTISIDDDSVNTTELDKLIRLTLPGKTEKEKKIKRSVDCLIKLMMKESGIKSIKLPSGQIIVLDQKTERYIEGENVRKFNGDPHTVLDDNGKHESRKESIMKNLSSEKLKDYSKHVQDTIQRSMLKLDKQANSRCKVDGSLLQKILIDLDVPMTNEQIISKLKESFKQRSNFTRNNDKIVIRSPEDIAKYIESRKRTLTEPSKGPFGVDCLLFKEVASEAMLRYQSTSYQGCVDYTLNLIDVLLQFIWFQEIVIYAKICETFLRICTEFNRAGIKLLRVRHLDLNLAVKLPSNKKKNMLCILYDRNMEKLKDPFFLNRRQAVLGAAYPYILTTLYIQVLQQQRCVELLFSEPTTYLDSIRNRTSLLIDSLKKELMHVVGGRFEDAYRIRQKICGRSGNFLSKSGFEIFINTMSGLNVVYGLIMKDSLLLNSQPQNKQLQMLRYGMLNGLSRISCPRELGRKFSSSCRKIEENISRAYLQSTIYCSNRDIDFNIKGWKGTDLCPDIKIPCFTIYGVHVSTDRQLIFDIYNVHIYNKEMDDFEEGCIKVLEETADRHMMWENDLTESFKSEEKFRASRLLMGYPNVKVGAAEGRSELRRNGKNNSSAGSLAGSNVTRRSAKSSGSGSVNLFSRYSSISKPLSVSVGMEVEPDVLRSGRPVATGGPSYYIYKPNKASVLKDLLAIIRKNPNYTMGSYELIQAATEFAKFKYPPESLKSARMNPKNWTSISEVTETTSIIAAPKATFSVKDAISVISSSQNKKIAKMLKNKLKKLGSLFTDTDTCKQDCSVLLSTVETLSDEQKRNIIDAIFVPSKLTIYNWKQILSKPLRETLLTHDGNVIYCWIKSLAVMVKSKLSKHLKFMDPNKTSRSLSSTLFSEAECSALLAVKELLTDRHRELDFSFLPAPIESAWLKCIELNLQKLNIEIITSNTMLVAEELSSLKNSYNRLLIMKRENPGASFVREEGNIRHLEKTFLSKYERYIVELANLLMFIAVSAPWCSHYKSLESYLVRHPEILDISDDETSTDPILSLSVPFVFTTFIISKLEVVGLDLVSLEHKLRYLSKYVITLFTSNSEPFASSVANDELTISAGNDIEERLLSQTKRIFAKLGLSGKNYDFIWTIQMIANSNFNVCRKLTGRSEGERLPRSLRSKVVYEMIKLVGETGMAILQQIAFTKALHYSHRFFSVLAPKAQLGGSRDLLVQETSTKLIHATTETFSRSILGTTEDDGLTNPKLKEAILGTALDSLSTMRKIDGTLVEGSNTLYTFYRVVCISGDNTKWGPIHCCTFFSGMIQQLLKDHQDWVSLYKITFIKNICRQVEIPASSLKKILNVLKYKTENLNLSNVSENEARNLLGESQSYWSDLPYVSFLIKNYLSRGILAMNSYNHMGQGIHHATSSLLTSIMSELFQELCVHHYKKHFPNLTVEIHHAGSSDDYAKCIIVTGKVDKLQYSEYDNVFWNVTCRFKNMIMAVNRCCQMKDSVKTLTGDCFLEFYSEFMMGYRITPAVIKFIFTGLINSSVTSPSSLSQACHVSSQQAMYNSVPMLTNITFTLLRQQIFFNHVEAFTRRFGPLVLGSVSQFGRLYCPKYSNLIGSSITLEDSEAIVEACKQIQRWDVLFETSSRATLVTDDTRSTESESSETSSFKSEKFGDFLLSDEKKVLTEQELLFMDVSHERTRHTDTMSVEKAINKFYVESRDQIANNKDVLLNSVLCNSCEWMIEARKKCFLEVAFRMQCVLRVLCFGYYRSLTGQGTEKKVKASLCRDENQIIEDPMIQLLPEKLRRELDRLGISRMEVSELLPKFSGTESVAEIVAQKLISLNISTESYSAEVSRLKQTLTARNVLYGLAGGVKELSIPIYTIFLKSYFFKDNVFLNLNDRWPNKHSSNYRDSTGKKLDGKVVTKYPYWINVFLGCTISADRHSSLNIKSLFNDSLRCISILHNNEGLREMSVSMNQLRTVEKELSALILQFSNQNRQKLRIVESRPADYEMEANKVVITKSSLFTTKEGVRLKNNPAVVIGYLLDESSISEVKPTKVDFSSLLKDRFKLSQYFPSIMSVLQELKEESEEQLSISDTPDLDVAAKYVNYLTLLCRMMMQSQSTMTVFYMIKSNKYKNEPTVSDLVSYGIKEGRYLKLPELDMDITTYSVNYWKISQCISAIGQLPISSDDKRDILLGFMNWKVDSKCLDEECIMHKFDKAVCEELNDQTIINVLASELHTIKDKRERESLSDLVDYILSPRELIKKKPYLGTTSSFNTWGEGTRTGRFTYSSRSGESTGIFVGSKLHIYLSNDGIALLDETERHVLGWLSQRRTDILTVENHNLFLDLLPSTSEIGAKSSEGKLLSVVVDLANPKFLRYLEPQKAGKIRVVRIKKHILTVKKVKHFETECDPRLIWARTGLSIVFDETSTDTLYHEALLRVKELIQSITGLKKVDKDLFSETQVIVTRLRFSSPILLNSLSLLHTFLVHAPVQALTEVNLKSRILSELVTSGAVAKGKLSRLLEKLETASFPFKSEPLVESDQKTFLDLSESMTESAMPLACWPEVQKQVELLGLGDFILSFDGEGRRGKVTWRLESKERFEESRIDGLLDLTSSLESGVLPGCLVPFAFYSTKMEVLIRLSKRAHEAIMNSRYSRKTVDYIILFTLFCFQSDKKNRRKGLCFTPGSLLSLIRSRIEVDEKVQLLAECAYDEVEILFEVRCVLPQDVQFTTKQAKVERVVKVLSSSMSRFVFDGECSLDRIKEVFKDVRLEKKEGITVSFKADTTSTGLFDYHLITFASIEDYHLVQSIKDLVMFLMGFEVQLEGDIDRVPNEEDEDIDLDDILNVCRATKESEDKEVGAAVGKVEYSDDEY